MIKRLRIKFILIAMLSLFFVLAILVASINILAYRGVVERADETLDIILSHQGRFPQIQQRPAFPDIKDWDEPYSNIPVETRFFSVIFSKNGDPVSVIMDNISINDRQSAIKMAKHVLNGEDERGFFGNYRYLVSKRAEHSTVILLDCTNVLTANRNFMIISIFISAIGMLAVFCLLFFLSKLVTDPVSESIEKQKSFITDAGHELKTPITIIDADAELIEMENGESEWSSDIRQQTKRLKALTNDLIFLSRMEEESFVLPKIELPISDVVKERAASFASIFKTNGKNLDIRVEEMLSVRGDEKSVSQLVSILLDNAAKYSEEGDTVLISLKKHNKSVLLTVSNKADESVKENVDKLFDRFFRGDKSRASGGGYGLGLSVARAITLSHRGKIWAQYTEDGRLEINVLLPI